MDKISSLYKFTEITNSLSTPQSHATNIQGCW